MSQSRITGAVLLCWEDCTSILSKHLTTLLQRPIQLCRMVEDYDYWCVASINGRFSIPELHSLLDALSATTADFPDLIPEESNQTRSFSMEFSRALLQHFLHASWRYEHLTEEYLMVSVQYSAHEKLNKAYDSYCNSRFRMPCFYEALLKSVWNSPLLIFKRLLPIAFRYDNNCRKKASYH